MHEDNQNILARLMEIKIGLTLTYLTTLFLIIFCTILTNENAKKLRELSNKIDILSNTISNQTVAVKPL